MYPILEYTKRKAKELNVKVKPSTNPKKKIDVFNNNNQFITSVGSKGYSDYPTYLKDKGKAYADKRRELYKKRHANNRLKKGTAGFYADNLLW